MEEFKKFFLQPGYIFVSHEPHLIHTVLGSCVAVCIWDSVRKFGGVASFIYGSASSKNRSGKYGQVAIPHLIELLLELGSDEKDLKVHIVGGGEHPKYKSGIGHENAITAEKLLKKYPIEVLTRDIRGEFGRKVIFNSGNGEILIYKMHDIRKDDWYGCNGTEN